MQPVLRHSSSLLRTTRQIWSLAFNYAGIITLSADLLVGGHFSKLTSAFGARWLLNALEALYSVYIGENILVTWRAPVESWRWTRLPVSSSLRRQSADTSYPAACK